MSRAFTAVILALGIVFGAPAFAQIDCKPGEVVIKFSHVVPPSGHPKGDFARMLAERVNTELNGKACMQVFPFSQLYDDEKVMEALILGDVQLAAPSLSKLEVYTNKYRLFDLPFLFEDMDAVQRFTASEKGQELLGVMSDFGVVGLGYLFDGLKHFSADKPLLVPSDGAGLKFRVQNSDVAVAMIEAMGASAQKLAFKEVYGALQLGVVDGQENSWSNIFTSRFFEVQDGTTETNHQLLAYVVFTPQEWLESLEPDVRELFLTIFRETLVKANGQAAKTSEVNRQRIVDAGYTVRELTPKQRQQWVDVMRPVWGDFEDEIGKDLIDAAEAANVTKSN
ncbi:C4-dicarboxylate-binding periplasmic protein precursor [Pseudovibrio axinellae]|uniref:C4-dicarboxylate-binding periplasmic protein n=1 Tax=Pseudovibrio axinellae TaxID=989403 RepID=A0A161V6S2_9HYPH|nr:DctP family TRAP transporter solute-binding subunit [Pseudovibrio axinellae]KZL20621.1 C4-dicarboxylate-binding periplasmic protein precursor [Pseudovibrio axinellae]SER27653.1 C4-dicarboxylate-binding protein DctP [Pseudovibrio axinellae]